MEIKNCPDSMSQAWNDYVHANEGGTFFHLYGWRKILQSVLKHDTYYFVATEGEKIVGLIPLVHVKSILFGNNMSSLAFASYGGAIADNELVRVALENKAVELGNSLGVGSVEFRYLSSTKEERPRKDLYERFTKEIFPTEEQNFAAIRGKQRNIIRKGAKKGLELREDTCKVFYEVYAESVRNLGTPVFPSALFEAMLETFPEYVEVLTAHLDGEPVSSAIVYYFKNEVCPYYWGGRYIARNLAGNDFLAWQILCRAAEKGMTTFDFGRSKKDTGSRQWKVNLGFEAEELSYEYILIRDTEMPDLNPLNPKYKLLVNVWKKLPLPVSSRIGPVVSKYLG